MQILVDSHQPNDIIVSVIPAFNDLGTLPSGIHPCTWIELTAALGWSNRRKWLLTGLEAAARTLKLADCKILYVDGSFVTKKEDPGDFDGCWDFTGVDPTKIDPILLRFDQGRLAQKAKFRGELFVAQGIADSTTGRRYMDFFQQDKDGNSKGLLALDLGSLP